MKRRHQQKLIVLALFLLVAYNLPVFLLFDSADSVGGIPVIYIYIFSVWLFSVIMSYAIVTRYYE